MNLKDAHEMQQVFFNLSQTRGLLWPDIIEGILFTRSGLPNFLLNPVSIDKEALIYKIKLTDINEIINFILVLDYIIDYLKNTYSMSYIAISTLLHAYLLECHIFHFKSLMIPTGNCLIETNGIITSNPIFKFYFSDIFIWLIKQHLIWWHPNHFYIKHIFWQNRQNQSIHSIVWIFLQSTNPTDMKKLLTIQYQENARLWKQYILKFKLFLYKQKRILQ